LESAYQTLLQDWNDILQGGNAVIASANSAIFDLQNQLDAQLKLVAALREISANSIDRKVYLAAIEGLEKQINDLNIEITRLKEDKPKSRIDPKNPLPNSIFNMQNVGNDALFWLAMVVIAKKDPRGAERIITKMYDVTATSLRAYCSAGVGNRVAAWGAGQLLSLFMERHGMVTQEQALNFQFGQTIIAGAQTIKDLSSIFRDLPLISYLVAPEGIEAPSFPQSVSLVDSILPSIAKEVGPALLTGL
jgi:hypothetical protein